MQNVCMSIVDSGIYTMEEFRQNTKHKETEKCVSSCIGEKFPPT